MQLLPPDFALIFGTIQCLLKGERKATADGTDADGVHSGWLYKRGREVTEDLGRRAAAADCRCSYGVIFVGSFGMAASLHFGMDTPAPPEVGVEVMHLYIWCHHGESVVEVSTP